jgi:uncharacterized protein YraI
MRNAMKNLHLAAAAAVGLLALSATPSFAAVFSGYTTANVNQRSGPSTAYPPITVIPAGASITIYGCLSDDSWCDISWGANRGWMSSAYLQVSYQSHRYPVRGYSGIPFITFNFGNYWDSYYRNRPFFSQRGKWSNYNWQKPGQGPNNPPPQPPPPPKYTGNPPNMGNPPPNPSNPPKFDGKPPKFDKGSPFNKGGQNYNNDNNKNHGKNCKWIDGKWVCT